MDTPPQLGLGSAQIPERSVEGSGQFIEIVGASVSECIVHLVPHTLIGIEFWRIRWETLQMKPREGATEFADGFALVGFTIVPNNDDMATQMTEQMAYKPAHLSLLDVLAVELAIQSEPPARWTDRYRRDGRDLIVLVAVPDEGSLSARPPRATDWRDQEIAGFVDENDMGTQPRRVFFMRGHSRFFHASIASSSRCVARFSGF